MFNNKDFERSILGLFFVVVSVAVMVGAGLTAIIMWML